MLRCLSGGVLIAAAVFFALPIQASVAQHDASAVFAVARCSQPGPSVVEIGLQMSSTVEASDRTTHFTAWSQPLTVPDGRGNGTITAVVGVRYPTADARGQLVFFWHGTTYVGWDSQYENDTVRVSSPAAGVFTITYNGRKKITYAWSSNRIFIANGVPPGKSVKVKRI